MRQTQAVVSAILVLAVIAFGSAVGDAADLLPWQRWVEKPDPQQSKPLDDLFALPWRNSGGKEGRLTIADDRGPWGGKYFNFHVKVDHHNAGKYPLGWPSFEVQPNPPLDFTGYEALSYWIRCDTKLHRRLLLRFILWTDHHGRINTPIPPFLPGRWVQVVHKLKSVPRLDKVDRIHFFLSESDYDDGDEMTFRIGGFRLCNLQRRLSTLPPDEAALGLWVGDRPPGSERIAIEDAGATSLSARLVIETGTKAAFRAADELRVTFHEVFTGKETSRRMSLGSEVPAGKVTRLARRFDVSGLAPGYYLVVTDVRRNGTSLLHGRVGADDFYLRKPGESMTCTVLSIRTGMVLWLRDLLYGDIMGWAHAALPHVYNPLDKTTYRDFLKLFATSTWKHTEGNEAGDTGLALAAEAFRKTGELTRCRFVESLLDDSLTHMIQRMQAPSGAVRTMTNELAAGGYATNWAAHGYTYDSNQIGEWMRALTYALIYYRRIPEKRARVRELDAALRKAADYLAAHATKDSDGIPRVLRHLRLVEGPDGHVRQVVYHQEGRQCDVYLGRALSGLAYYAYARQLCGEPVPDSWWTVLDNTVRWCARKMKPNGWFDWQCADVVEGGCHTYLGNIYVGEGLFGVYLADKTAGRDAAAATALHAAHKAYRYVTDSCRIKGKAYEPPTEFWVGPYLYWLFTEYLDAAGPEPVFQRWLSTIDRTWRVDRKWKDFLDRPRNGQGYVGRASANGMLNVAILGYLGIRQMTEIGRPFHWTTAKRSPR